MKLFSYFSNESPIPQISIFYHSPIYVFLFICIFVKIKLNQSDDRISCHNSLITLLNCHMCFTLLTYQTLYTGYPQKYLQPFRILYQGVLEIRDGRISDNGPNWK